MLPPFNASMVLPPYTGSSPTMLASMSPYKVGFLEFVQQFATSKHRADLLCGLITYREALRNVGVTQGFQWLDGSFVENVEQSRGRPPADIDVVTFAHGQTHADPDAYKNWLRQNKAVFDPSETKRIHNCDAYFVDLGRLSPGILVDRTRYWFGLFSHQRSTGLWKGMVQVPLEPDDIQARTMLENLHFDNQGGDNA